MNLTEITYMKIKYRNYTKISENKATLFFYRRKQNGNSHEENVENPC